VLLNPRLSNLSHGTNSKEEFFCENEYKKNKLVVVDHSDHFPFEFFHL